MNPNPLSPRLGLACSGLGWVRRGNEAWAQGLAEGLSARGVALTLFGGGPLEGRCAYRQGLTLRREHPVWRRWCAWGRRYAWEQSLFAAWLARAARYPEYDILHSGDPQIAWGLQRRRSAHGASVIYKDGLLLGPDWNRNLDWVQVLAPHYLESGAAAGVDTRRWRMIPHFIEPSRFVSRVPKAEVRREILGDALLPEAPVILAAGALGTQNQKRLGWVAGEVAQVAGAHLLVVGQAEAADQAAFEQQVRPLLGQRLHLHTNVHPDAMPRYFLAADLFAHAALREPFGIVLIEALAAGLPVLGHAFPVTRWIIGEGGESLDMESPGALAAAIHRLVTSPGERQALGAAARSRALREFSPEAILPRYEAFYADIRAERAGARRSV